MIGPNVSLPASRMAKYRDCKNSFDFATDLERAAEVLGMDSVRETCVMLALVLIDKITWLTPVDTGRARANWFIAEGAPITQATESTTPSNEAPGLTGRQPIYITNNLPYIIALEYGHSGQAPFGMVRIALAQIKTGIQLGRPAA